MSILTIFPGINFKTLTGDIIINRAVNMHELEVGYDIPAAIGMDESEIQTPRHSY